jgi:pimeloyl-ACP methyl ester carboxylesterase
MELPALAVIAGLVAGRLLPPQPRHLARFTIHRWWLLGGGVAAQVVAARLDGSLALALVLVSYGCLVAFAVANLHLTGMGVVAVGLGLNIVPILLNGGMPVRGGALVEAGIVEPEQLEGLEFDGHRHLEDDGDILAFLGDALPITATHQVVSFGDLVLVAGAADVVANLTRRRRSSRVDVRADGSTIDLRYWTPPPELAEAPAPCESSEAPEPAWDTEPAEPSGADDRQLEPSIR